MSVVGDDAWKYREALMVELHWRSLDFFFFLGHIFADIFASKILSLIANVMGKSWCLVLNCTSLVCREEHIFINHL